MAVVSLLGSARSDGDAATLCDAVTAGCPATQLDLGVLVIRDYAYDRPNTDDDFLGVAHALARADGVLLVTPVYWYAMSAVMKRFMDRLTDLVTVDKSLGRGLAGRGVWVAACGSDPAAPDGFDVPFRRTADYFGMTYGGMIYAQSASLNDADERRRLRAFGAQISAFRAVSGRSG